MKVYIISRVLASKYFLRIQFLPNQPKGPALVWSESPLVNLLCSQRCYIVAQHIVYQIRMHIDCQSYHCPDWNGMALTVDDTIQ